MTPVPPQRPSVWLPAQQRPVLRGCSHRKSSTPGLRFAHRHWEKEKHLEIPFEPPPGCRRSGHQRRWRWGAGADRWAPSQRGPTPNGRGPPRAASRLHPSAVRRRLPLAARPPSHQWPAWGRGFSGGGRGGPGAATFCEARGRERTPRFVSAAPLTAPRGSGGPSWAEPGRAAGAPLMADR